MKSSWLETKEKSAYHFDDFAVDPRWDNVNSLGNLTPTWQNDIDQIVENSKPATWETRGYKGQGVVQPRPDLASEEYDLESIGADPKMVITHMNWEIPESLQRISDAFAMDDTMNRLHVQMPGEVWTRHIDKLDKWSPDNPSRVLRIFIPLQDWRPGQFWEFGNYHWNKWRAGQVIVFDWENVPHCTANAGHDPRLTFQITGVKTTQTLRFLEKLRSVNEVTVE